MIKPSGQTSLTVLIKFESFSTSLLCEKTFKVRYIFLPALWTYSLPCFNCSRGKDDFALNDKSGVPQ